MMSPSMSSMADRINQLRDRASDVAARIAGFKDARSSASLRSIFDDDREAQKIIRDADLALDALSKESQTITSALSAAEALLTAEHAEAEKAERTERAIVAHRCAQGIAALNGELDDLLLKTRQCFEKRATLLADLARCEVAPPAYLQRFGAKGTASRAFAAAGLHRFCDLITPSALSFLPLASTNPQLLAIGIPPADWPSEDRRGVSENPCEKPGLRARATRRNGGPER
jgi:hypothetical protein